MNKTLATRISADIDDAIDDLGREVKRAGAAIGDDAKDALTQITARLRRAAHQLTHDARREAAHVVEDPLSDLRRQPLAAVGIAAAAVAFVSFMLWRAQTAD